MSSTAFVRHKTRRCERSVVPTDLELTSRVQASLRIVAQQLNDFLKSSDLLSSLQSGFRSGSSTETAVLCVLSDLLEAVDRGDVAALVLLPPQVAVA